MLAEIFKSTKPYVEPKEEHRPDRALDPGEELEALLTGFKNKNQHIFPVEGPIKRESGPEPGTNGLDQQNMMLTGNGPVARDGIPRPDDNANLMQIPNTAFAAASPDAGQNLMQLPEQQTPGNPDASFMQMLHDQDELKKQHELQGNELLMCLFMCHFVVIGTSIYKELVEMDNREENLIGSIVWQPSQMCEAQIFIIAKNDFCCINSLLRIQ